MTRAFEHGVVQFRLVDGRASGENVLPIREDTDNNGMEVPDPEGGVYCADQPDIPWLLEPLLGYRVEDFKTNKEASEWLTFGLLAMQQISEWHGANRDGTVYRPDIHDLVTVALTKAVNLLVLPRSTTQVTKWPRVTVATAGMLTSPPMDVDEWRLSYAYAYYRRMMRIAKRKRVETRRVLKYKVPSPSVGNPPPAGFYRVDPEMSWGQEDGTAWNSSGAKLVMKQMIQPMAARPYRVDKVLNDSHLETPYKWFPGIAQMHTSSYELAEEHRQN
jgi:hypothetical protein